MRTAVGRGDRGVQEIQHVVVEDSALLQRCAHRALGERADRRAGDDRKQRLPADESELPRRARRARAHPRDLPRFPRAKSRPECPAAPAGMSGTRHVRGPTPCRFRWPSCRCRQRRARRRTPIERGCRCVAERAEHRRRRRDPGVRERISGAAPAAAPLGDAELRLAPQPDARGDHRHAERGEKQHPSAHPTVRTIAMPMKRAADRAGDRHRAERNIRRPRRPHSPTSAAAMTATGRRRERCDRVLADERHPPENGGRGCRHRHVVVEPDRDGFDRRRSDGRDQRHRRPKTTGTGRGRSAAGTTSTATIPPRRRI